MLLLLAGCQGIEASPPPQGSVVTIGETTIRTGGSARVDFVYVN